MKNPPPPLLPCSPPPLPPNFSTENETALLVSPAPNSPLLVQLTPENESHPDGDLHD
jgi:hypothetical protein